MLDPTLTLAIDLVRAARAGAVAKPVVQSFFDAATNTASHMVHDPTTLRGAIIDSVLDFDAAAGRISTASGDAMIDAARARGLTIDWLLETHIHADHLSAASHIRGELGGKLAIGRRVGEIERFFGRVFDAGPDPARGGAPFERLFDDGDRFSIGGIPAIAMHAPGHTAADMAYVIGDAVFAGDTMFMPDCGTARADFPGGDARRLYRSIRRLLSLPGETRLFLCHDYKATGRDSFAWETTVGAQRRSNIHVHDGIGEDDFVSMRTGRDAGLSVPRLLLPAMQVNLRGGRLPPAQANGIRYLKLPLNAV